MQGKMEGKRRRGRPATTWFQDLKEWTKLDIAVASQLATDRERRRKTIKVTAPQTIPVIFAIDLQISTIQLQISAIQ